MEDMLLESLAKHGYATQKVSQDMKMVETDHHSFGPPLTLG
jgi:hypothetical protein